MEKVTKANVIFTSLILIYIIMIFTVRMIPSKYLNYNVISMLPEIVFFLAAVVVSLLIKSRAYRDAGWGNISVGTGLKSVVLAFLCLPLIGAINYFSSMVNGNAVEGSIERLMENPLWLSLIIVAVLPALVEEFIFRGILLGAYKKRNPLKGILLSALLFGFTHLNINQMAYAFVLGIILGLLAYATGSIWAGVILHFTINANSVIMAYATSNINTEDIANQSASAPIDPNIYTILIAVITVLIILASSIALAVLLFLNICKHNRGIKSVKAIFTKSMRRTYGDEGKFFDGYLILGIVICSVFIFCFDILVNIL